MSNLELYNVIQAFDFVGEILPCCKMKLGNFLVLILASLIREGLMGSFLRSSSTTVTKAGYTRKVADHKTKNVFHVCIFDVVILRLGVASHLYCSCCP